MEAEYLWTRQVRECLKLKLVKLEAHAIGAGGLGFDFRVGQIDAMSPAARHRYNVSSELCCPGAKPRR